VYVQLPKDIDFECTVNDLGQVLMSANYISKETYYISKETYKISKETY